MSHLRRGLVSLNSRHQFVSEIALMFEHAKAAVNLPPAGSTGLQISAGDGHPQGRCRPGARAPSCRISRPVSSKPISWMPSPSSRRLPESWMGRAQRLEDTLLEDGLPFRGGRRVRARSDCDVHDDCDDEVAGLPALISDSSALSVSMIAANRGGSPKSITPILR